MKKNTIEVISSDERAKLAKEAQELCPASMIKKAKSILTKLGLPVTGGMKDNLRAFWTYHYNALLKLPVDNKFRKQMVEDKRWKSVKEDGSILVDYLKHTGCYSDFQLLSSPAWDELERFGSYVLPQYSLPPAGLKVWFDFDGDYDLYLSQFLINNLDPECLKKTKELKQITDKLFQNVPVTERYAVINTLLLIAGEETMTIEKLHRKLNPGPRTSM